MRIDIVDAERHREQMIYIGIAAAIFFGDLVIKNYMEKTLVWGEEKKKLKGMLLLRKHHNKGAFLNAGQEKRPAVAAISLLLTLLITIVFILTLGRHGNAPLKTGLAMLLGGAFSNSYDRIKRKYVVDYFSFGGKCRPLSSIIFNISDFGIIIGALIAALNSHP